MPWLNRCLQLGIPNHSDSSVYSSCPSGAKAYGHKSSKASIKPVSLIQISQILYDISDGEFVYICIHLEN